MQKIMLFLFSFVGFFSSIFAQSDKDLSQIQAVLKMQETAWNAGNLEEYMQGYWQSDSLTFIGKSGLTKGWQKTLDNYKKGYPSQEAMGKLNFTLLKMEKLDKNHAFVVGKWHLTRTKGDLEGHFSLVWQKIKGKWVIISDHSS
jgi:ketosteroid isomerase-like protein